MVELDSINSRAQKDAAAMSADKRKSKEKTQRQRFIDAAREAGASEDEAVFRENLKRLATAKPKPKEDEGGR